MQHLAKQEQFEVEVLDRLNSGRFLDALVFTGGTMLRLCYGLNRYSLDLDFWLYKAIETNSFYKKLEDYLARNYMMQDAENKYHTMLFELKSKAYPSKLKIEIRKNIQNAKTELSIAYSRYSNIQVMLRTLSLDELLKTKIKAFLDRQEIRDVFDIEFLLKKGIALQAQKEELAELLKGIKTLKRSDYTVKLGSILEPEERKYYAKENFKILIMKINDILQRV